jgi:hypothetical protein
MLARRAAPTLEGKVCPAGEANDDALGGDLTGVA